MSGCRQEENDREKEKRGGEGRRMLASSADMSPCPSASLPTCLRPYSCTNNTNAVKIKVARRAVAAKKKMIGRKKSVVAKAAGC
jgi:hypothetical protein